MKLLRYIILFCLLFVLVSCNDEVTPQHTFPDAEYAVNATDMAVVGDKIYYIREEKVYETASDAAVFEEFPAEYIASDGKELAVYGGGRIWCGKKTYTVVQTEIESFVYADGIFCWSYMQDELPQIGFYNTQNGDGISAAPLSGVFCEVRQGREHHILISCYEASGEMVTYEFNLISMKPGNYMTEDFSREAAFSDADTLVLLRSNGRVTVRHLTDGTEEKRNACPELGQSTRKFDFSGDSCIFLNEDGTIYARQEYCTPIEPGNTVVILQDRDSGYFDEVLLEQLNHAFEERGPEIVVTENSADQIRLKQLAGDDDYDLYVSDGYSIVLDYPIYEPLNDFQTVTNQFDLMYDEIRDICTFDGDLYGVLLNLQVQNSLWSYNAELLEELGMTLPEPSWTLEDYYEMAAAIRAKGHYISRFTPLYLSDYLHVFGDMYQTKSLTDNGTMLRRYLEIMKKLRKDGLLYTPETAAEGAKTLFGGSGFPFEERYNRETRSNELVLQDVWYPVTFDGRMPDMTIMDFLQMNRNSLNKENAALVMAQCMKPEYIENRGLVLYRETGEAIRGISEKAGECFEIYLNVLAGSRPHYNHDRDAALFMNNEAEKYYNDEQDLDYTAEKIYSRAKMLFEE